MKKLVIIGIGLSAKQVFDFVTLHNLYSIVGFAVDSKYKNEDVFLGMPVFNLENLKNKINIDEVEIFVSLGWNRLNSERKNLYERLKGEGYRFGNLISPLAVLKGKIEGDNCWVNDYAVLQSDSIIKSDVILREHVVIGNTAVINEHCFIGVHGVIGGGAVIGKQTFVGMRGTVFDGTKIGDKCIVGACAFAKRHLPNYSVCKTMSDSIKVQQYKEEEIEEKLVAGKGVR